jgi:mannose-6-phosphate isomerase-like protein (cupin superfamily)
MADSKDQMQFVFSTKDNKRYRLPRHTNDLVMDRADAETSEVFFVVLEPGEAPPPHKHDDTEQIFYILEGEGVLRIGEQQKEFAVRPSDVVRIPPKVLHCIQCAGQKPLRYLAIDCFTNDRPKDEPTWDSHARAMCQQRGWDYQQVVRPAAKKA